MCKAVPIVGFFLALPVMAFAQEATLTVHCYDDGGTARRNRTRQRRDRQNLYAVTMPWVSHPRYVSAPTASRWSLGFTIVTQTGVGVWARRRPSTPSSASTVQDGHRNGGCAAAQRDDVEPLGQHRSNAGAGTAGERRNWLALALLAPGAARAPPTPSRPARPERR